MGSSHNRALYKCPITLTITLTVASRQRPGILFYTSQISKAMNPTFATEILKIWAARITAPITIAAVDPLAVNKFLYRSLF